MRKLGMALTAAFAMALLAAPAIQAQEPEKEQAMDVEKKKAMEMEKAHEHAHEHEMKLKTLEGTMTPPDQETMEITYEMGWNEDGAKGWIVGTDESGEPMRHEMTDLVMEGDNLSYQFSPDGTMIVSCTLTKQEDGGFAGDCTDDQAEGRTGKMTVAPPKEMEQKSP